MAFTTTFDVQIMGEAVIDYGLTASGVLDGFGLNTFGFIWGRGNIWFACEDTSLTSTWTDCETANN